MALIGDKRVYTSEKGEKILDHLRDFTNLDLSVLAKIAISVSIKNRNKFSEQKFDSDGRMFRGINIFGEDALLYYSVLCSINNKHISDNGFFPEIPLSKTI